MGFEPCRRFGNLWGDAQKLDVLIKNHNFNINARTEREFENSFSSVLMSRKNEFQNKIMSQMDKETTVNSVYCFGKKHRPDITFENDGIAIEIKHIDESTDNLKISIGQTILYRLRYKFVFQIFVLSKNHQGLYGKICNSEEKDLEDLFSYLADDLNVFSYIVPAFCIKSNIKKIFSVHNMGA